MVAQVVLPAPDVPCVFSHFSHSLLWCRYAVCLSLNTPTPTPTPTPTHTRLDPIAGTPQFVLSENPDLQCYTGQWKSFFLPASIAVGVLWVGMLPIMTAFFSVRAAYRVKWAFKSQGSSTMSHLDRNVNKDIARFGCT